MAAVAIPRKATMGQQSMRAAAGSQLADARLLLLDNSNTFSFRGKVEPEKLLNCSTSTDMNTVCNYKKWYTD